MAGVTMAKHLPQKQSWPQWTVEPRVASPGQPFGSQAKQTPGWKEKYLSYPSDCNVDQKIKESHAVSFNASNQSPYHCVVSAVGCVTQHMLRETPLKRGHYLQTPLHRICS